MIAHLFVFFVVDCTQKCVKNVVLPVFLDALIHSLRRETFALLLLLPLNGLRHYADVPL